MSMHFLGYQGSCNKNTSKYVSAFCWYKVVSMVWLSLCIPIRNKGVIFPLRKEKTYSESLARGWVSLLRCSSPVMINDKPLCSLESPPHTPRARSKGGHILPSSLTPAWRPGTAPSFQSPQVKLCRNRVKCEKQVWFWNLDGSFHWKGQNTCSGVDVKTSC